MVKLPSGKVIETMFGGPHVLKDLLSKLEDEKLDGYIQLKYLTEEIPHEGSIVINKGVPALTFFSGEVEKIGEKAIRSLIADSLDDDCIVEVHSFSYSSSSINVNYLIKQFPEAVVDISEIDLDEEAEYIRKEKRKSRRKQLDDEWKAFKEGKERLNIEEEIFEKEHQLNREMELRLRDEDSIKRLQTELNSIKLGSLALIKHFSGHNTRNTGDEEVIRIAERKLEDFKIQQALDSLEKEKSILNTREKKVGELEENLKKKEMLLKAREDELEKEEKSIEKEREELDSIWKGLAEETDKISQQKNEIEARMAEYIENEKILIERENEWNDLERSLKEERRGLTKQKEELSRKEEELTIRIEGLHEMEERINEIKNDVEAKKKELKKEGIERKKEEQRLNRLKREIEDREDDISTAKLALNRERDELTFRERELEVKLEAFEKEKNNVRKEKETISELKNTLKAFENDLKNIQKDLEDRENNLKEDNESLEKMQKDLEKQTGVSRNSISRIERGMGDNISCRTDRRVIEAIMGS